MNSEDLLAAIAARNEQDAVAAYEKAWTDALSGRIGALLMLAAQNACAPLRVLHAEIQSLKP